MIRHFVKWRRSWIEPPFDFNRAWRGHVQYRGGVVKVGRLNPSPFHGSPTFRRATAVRLKGNA